MAIRIVRKKPKPLWLSVNIYDVIDGYISGRFSKIVSKSRDTCNNYNFQLSCLKEVDNKRVCDCCQREFTTQSLGIIKNMHTDKYLCQDGKIASKYKFFFYSRPRCCSFECVLTILARGQGQFYTQRDFSHKEAETLTKFLYSLCYPGKTLKFHPHPEFYLREEKGGRMTNSEYYAKTHSFVSCAAVELISITM